MIAPIEILPKSVAELELWKAEEMLEHYLRAADGKAHRAGDARFIISAILAAAKEELSLPDDRNSSELKANAMAQIARAHESGQDVRLYANGELIGVMKPPRGKSEDARP